MKLVVLGTTAALPTKRSYPSCFAVKHGGNYLFDCCEAVQRQCMKFDVSIMKINAVFLSHLHADHYLGLFGLTQSMGLMGRTAPLLIAGPAGTQKFFEQIFSIKSLSVKFPIVFKEAGKKKTKIFENDLFTVTAFPVKHAGASIGYCLECHSYSRFDEKKAKAAGIRGKLFSELQEKKVLKIGKKTVKLSDVTYVQQGKKLVYSGDTMPCDAVAKQAKNADLLIHESSFATAEEGLAKEKMHSTAAGAAKIAAKAKCKKLLLTHFSNRYEDRSVLLAEACKLFKQTELAQEGLELSI